MAEVAYAYKEDLYYYTAEDPAAEGMQNAMKLYCRTYQTSNEPVLLDDTDTYDHSPTADGQYVTWVDVKNSEIAVSRYSTGFAPKTILTGVEEDSYVYAPAVTTNLSGLGVVAWLRNPNAVVDGELNLNPEETEIWYATYDGTAWSAAAKAATVSGLVRTLAAAYDVTDTGKLYLDYQVDDQVYEVTVAADGANSGTVSLKQGGRSYVRNHSFVSWQNEAGLYLGTLENGTTLEVGRTLNESPVLAVYTGRNAESCRQAFWAINNQIWGSASTNGTTWSEPRLICTETGNIRELHVSTETTDASPTLVYLVDAKTGTNLARCLVCSSL